MASTRLGVHGTSVALAGIITVADGTPALFFTANTYPVCEETPQHAETRHPAWHPPARKAAAREHRAGEVASVPEHKDSPHWPQPLLAAAGASLQYGAAGVTGSLWAVEKALAWDSGDLGSSSGSDGGRAIGPLRSTDANHTLCELCIDPPQGQQQTEGLVCIVHTPCFG